MTLASDVRAKSAANKLRGRPKSGPTPLTPLERKIAERYVKHDGASVRTLAAEFKLHATTIYRIIKKAATATLVVLLLCTDGFGCGDADRMPLGLPDAGTGIAPLKERCTRPRRIEGCYDFHNDRACFTCSEDL